MHVAHVDLNLLQAFASLLETRNVTAAAKRAGITQSAMSRTLGRLREALGDPLFVRTPRGLDPTATALELAPRVTAAIAAANEVFAPRDTFDPAATVRTFRIAATDFAFLVLLPPLVKQLAVVAPQIAIAATSAPIEQLETGAIDLAIAFGAPARPGLRWQLLFDDTLVCVARRGHPVFGRRLTRDRYLALDHLAIPSDRDAIARVLGKQQRRVKIVAAHFLIAPALLRDSDLVLTTGARIAKELCRLGPLSTVPAPIDIGPVRVGQLWHERADRDPAHAWFRARVKEVAS